MFLRPWRAHIQILFFLIFIIMTDDANSDWGSSSSEGHIDLPPTCTPISTINAPPTGIYTANGQAQAGFQPQPQHFTSTPFQQFPSTAAPGIGPRAPVYSYQQPVFHHGVGDLRSHHGQCSLM